MKELEIKHMKATLTQGGRNKRDLTWIKAFVEYNKQHDKKLEMRCGACYFKVLHYHIGQL